MTPGDRDHGDSADDWSGAPTFGAREAATEYGVRPMAALGDASHRWAVTQWLRMGRETPAALGHVA